MPVARTHGQLSVHYQAILDVARGTAAGYQARPDAAEDRVDTGWPSVGSADDDAAAALVALALAACPTLPVNTFLAVPVGVRAALSMSVQRVLFGRDTLRGVVIDLVGRTADVPAEELESTADRLRAAGALIGVGGYGAPQPELTSIVRLKPNIVRLGRDWVRGIDQTTAKRTAIEVIGQLAGQLDAWVLAEGVSTAAELRVLANLQVPLAQGPFIGTPHTVWPEIDLSARAALPTVTGNTNGVLRGLLQHAYTATDVAAAVSVLPETSGFDVVVVLDEHRRPITLLEQDNAAAWNASEMLTVNINTSVSEVVQRALTRPRATRFAPVACIDSAGRYLGILRMERLMGHLAGV
ncbi:EAL domain-containing protein [uncultured Jatrophihabitans sp.]|uniref:EAL domain-containing protein n=1 Tax=uncultured Jatrophihabitans sp. TaxID=1610747 RepID=UPI0035C9CCC0